MNKTSPASGKKESTVINVQLIRYFLCLWKQVKMTPNKELGNKHFGYVVVIYKYYKYSKHFSYFQFLVFLLTCKDFLHVIYHMFFLTVKKFN